MVAVGDDELLVVHGAGQEADGCRVADSPDAMENSIVIGDFGLGGPLPS